MPVSWLVSDRGHWEFALVARAKLAQFTTEASHTENFYLYIGIWTPNHFSGWEGIRIISGGILWLQ